jgi:hypothetical protein
MGTNEDTAVAVSADRVVGTAGSAAVFRNSRALIGLVMLAGVVSGGIAGAMVLILFTTIFPVHDYSVHAALTVMQICVGIFFSASLAAHMWTLGEKMAHYQARLDERGVEFRLGTKGSPAETFFGWGEIAAVQHKKIVNRQWYGVLAKDRREVEFTGYTFFRGEKLVREVAGRAGVGISEV